MDGKSLKEAAMYYAELGFYVAPLWPKSKDPLRGFRYGTLSDDPEIIDYWWSRCDEANIALPTDRHYNNLIILDLDVGKGAHGREILDAFLQEHNLTLPQTATAQSGSGGVHLYYKNTQDIDIPTKKDLLPGVDLLAEGAHVVAPPSVHRSGKPYQWLQGDVESIAPADENVYALLRQVGLL